MRHIAADSALVSQGNVSVEPAERRHSVWECGVRRVEAVGLGWGTGGGGVKTLCLSETSNQDQLREKVRFVYHNVRGSSRRPRLHLLSCRPKSCCRSLSRFRQHVADKLLLLLWVETIITSVGWCWWATHHLRTGFNVSIYKTNNSTCVCAHRFHRVSSAVLHLQRGVITKM